ncbi:hypothetical protein [Vibrio taketomensis]|uniref:hypothetical protein n=1 Tax=Vibrio taketomensis TaxID=2572923 RepID=UPI001389EE41|nr:hypothetical protein [Vibrio taketomensis]
MAAYVEDSSVDASGALSIKSDTNMTIDAGLVPEEWPLLVVLVGVLLPQDLALMRLIACM